MKIAPNLTIDPDYFGGRTFAMLAKKGAGKTYQGRVMAEELWKAKVPFVAIDPMDVWWGLRSSASGKDEGLPIVIFGGPHGDAPLEPTAGKLMADLVVEEGISMILSLKHFGTRSAERRFAHDFLDRLYRTNSNLVHLLIDEADLFAPQKPAAGDQPLLGVTENIVRRGRNNGIGVTLMTQRPAVLNKDVLTQVDGLCVMRMLGPQDRKAVDLWVSEHGDEGLGKSVKDTLPDLANGECWWWIPEQGILERVKVRESKTFDSSPTQTRSGSTRPPKSLADVDLGAIQEKMAATIERAKADDPKELRKRIAELERQAAKPAAPAPEPVIERVEVPTLPGGHADALVSVQQSVDQITADLLEARGQLRFLAEESRKVPSATAQELATAIRKPSIARAGHGKAPARAPGRRMESVSFNPTGTPPQPKPRPSNGHVALDGVKPAQQKILDALASLESIGVPQPDKTQLALFVGVSPTSGGYFNNLGKLRSGGLIDYPAPATASLTDAGREIADGSSAPRSVEELHELVRRVVKPAQFKVLEPLIASYPDPIAKDELAETVGVSPTSGGYFNNLGKLRSLGLIDYPSPGQAVALPVLFLER